MKSPHRFEKGFEELLSEFRHVFPRSFFAMGAQKTEELLNSYLREFPWAGPPAQDHLRYLTGFLRLQNPDPRLYELAQKEWLWSYLKAADFGTSKTEPGRITVNPSLQVLQITEDQPEANLFEGLYIYYHDSSVEEVREYKMDLADAAVVDMLQEDRKYTLDQLIEQVLLMELPLSLDRTQWQKRIQNLISRGILSESGA